MSPAVRDYLVFQCGWAACVAFGNRGALLALLVFVPLQALWPARRRTREWLLVCGFSIAGIAMDAGCQAIGLLSFTGQLVLGIPLWLVVLWLLFSGTLFHSLAFLQQRLLLAAIVGATAGPLSYLAGMRLGAATTTHDAWTVALAMAPAWALLLPALAYAARPPNTGDTTI